MSEARRFLEDALTKLAAAEEARREIPEPSPPCAHRRICVGMATYDDFDGVWFTIQAIRMFHSEVAHQLGFLVLDNHPEGRTAPALKDLERTVPYLRYVPFRGYRGTGVRDLIFREANADIICCVDSHVLPQPGALAAIVRWFDDHPDSADMLQGPLISDALDARSTHFEPSWGAGMYGQWACDERAAPSAAEPFEIGMQGLGLFACRRVAWPGINPRFRGFGGEEGYLHEKVRRAGGRVLCHPAVGWVHRFRRPLKPPYPMSGQDVLRNYLIGWREVGWDVAPIEAHFRDHFETNGAGGDFERALERTSREAANPLSFFDGIFCLNLGTETERWTEARRRHEQLDIAWQVERFCAVPTPDNHHRGNAMSFRRMVADARRRGYEHVLILEDDAVFTDKTAEAMEAITGSLAKIEWDLCFVGAATRTHAVAVHRRAYDRILADIPTASSDVDRWLSEHVACDQYLSRRIADETFRAVSASPREASEPALLRKDQPDRRLGVPLLV